MIMKRERTVGIQGVLKVKCSLCEVGTPRSGCEHASPPPIIYAI